MSDAVLDFAGLDAAADAVDAGAGSGEVDLGEGVEETPVETTEGGEESAEGGEEGGEEAAEGEGEGKGEKGEKPAAKDEKLPGSESTPQNIRKALQALQKANPAMKDLAKTLHGSYERWNAAQQVFPKGVQEMKDAKALVDLVGGTEGYETFTAQKAAIEAVDAKLYSGDPSLVDDILSDLKEEGKLDVFPTLAMNFLDRLFKDNTEVFHEKMLPHYANFISPDGTNVSGAFGGIHKALLAATAEGATPEAVKEAVGKALGIAKNADEWAKGLAANAAKAKSTEVTPEKKALDEERKKFEQERTDFKTNQTKQFQESVTTATGKVDAEELGKVLGPIRKSDFFKSFTRENLAPLAGTIMNNLYSELKNDKIYQNQMKALWGAKDPSKDKLISYHTGKVKEIAQRIVEDTVSRMYPGYKKSTVVGAAGKRAAGAAAKTAADTKAAAASVATGKPQYVPEKPKSLVRSTDIMVGGKTYKSSDLQTMEITGKGFVKTPDGKGFRLVTWRK